MGGARFTGAHLEGATLCGTHLEGVYLDGAHLEGTRLPPDDLARIKQWKNDFPETLYPADVRGAFFSTATSLEGATFGDGEYGRITVVGARWDGVDLSAVNWGEPKRRKPLLLGDERVAREAKDENGNRKKRETRVSEFKDAARANRQLATALRGQGLSELADEMAYRSQVLQRQVLWRQRQVGAFLFSTFLGALTGYGYRLERIFIAYIAVILGFASLFLVGHALHTQQVGSQDVFNALSASLQAFHERQFKYVFNPRGAVTFLEAVTGLVIESTFVAMLVQRLRTGNGG